MPDLALVDDRLAVRVQELDRVLDRDDVLGHRPVHVVDHRRERGRLARAGGAGEQDDPALLLGELGDHGREQQLVDRLDHHRDGAHDQRDGAALAEGVDAEARQALHGVGEVDLVLGLELGDLGRVVEHPAQDAARCPRAAALGALDRREMAVQADQRRRGDLEVEVGALVGDEVVEGFVEIEVHRALYRPSAAPLEPIGADGRRAQPAPVQLRLPTSRRRIAGVRVEPARTPGRTAMLGVETCGSARAPRQPPSAAARASALLPSTAAWTARRLATADASGRRATVRAATVASALPPRVVVSEAAVDGRTWPVGPSTLEDGDLGGQDATARGSSTRWRWQADASARMSAAIERPGQAQRRSPTRRRRRGPRCGRRPLEHLRARRRSPRSSDATRSCSADVDRVIARGRGARVGTTRRGRRRAVAAAQLAHGGAGDRRASSARARSPWHSTSLAGVDAARARRAAHLTG